MSKLRLPRNSGARVVIAELERGKIPFEIWRRGKHWRIEANICGLTRRLTATQSPSDYRSNKNAEMQTRRIIRDARQSHVGTYAKSSKRGLA